MTNAPADIPLWQKPLEPGGVFDPRFTRDMNLHQRLHLMMTRLDYIEKVKPKAAEPGSKALRYSVVTHDAVTASVRAIAVECGVHIAPVNIDLKIQGNMSIVTMMVRFTNIDAPEDYMLVATCGNGIDPGDKGPGKAMSYAFKYALLKGLNLETGDDPDEDQDAVRATDAEIALDEAIKQLKRETPDVIKETIEGSDTLREMVATVSAENGAHAARLRAEISALARGAGLSLAEVWKK